MGYWGVKSYENDEAGDALDAAFERVHGDAYDQLMDDRDPLPFEQVQAKLADAATLAAALEALQATFGGGLDAWDEEARLAYAGVVVLHAEARAPIPAEVRDRAAAWLEAEDLEWDEPTKRDVRRGREIELLRRT